ncbi:MAG: glycerophosphodiester phosphodiesterase family protein, partial [Bacteroidales bacterium]|nr:glycerophosphodiester phosphodiesterase family protein [Candidatus Sodaliphilus fimicaballi]
MKRITLLLLVALTCLAASAGSFGKIVKALNDPKGKHVIVAAHRGDWRNAPENSLPAIQHCIDMGVDMVEIDLQKTKDGHLVLMHDFDVNRTSNGQGRGCDHNLKEIKKQRLKNGLGRVTPVQIPPLEEVFKVGHGKIL